MSSRLFSSKFVFRYYVTMQYAHCSSNVRVPRNVRVADENFTLAGQAFKENFNSDGQPISRSRWGCSIPLRTQTVKYIPVNVSVDNVCTIAIIPVPAIALGFLNESDPVGVLETSSVYSWAWWVAPAGKDECGVAVKWGCRGEQCL